jgi:hypothetical protein
MAVAPPPVDERLEQAPPVIRALARILRELDEDPPAQDREEE